MNKVKVHIDYQPFKIKPTGFQASIISTRITDEVLEITPEELSKLVGEQGRTALLATMEGTRGNRNMIQQQVLALDFDNKNDDTGERTEGLNYQTIEDTLRNPMIKEYASFIYKTFSYSDDWERFRVFFILDKPLKSNEEVENAYLWLQHNFPNADKAVKDSARLLYGGVEEVNEIDYTNKLEVSLFPEIVKEKKKPKRIKVSNVQTGKDKKAVYTGDSPTWELILEGKYEEISRRLEPFKAVVQTKAQAITYIKTLPMGEVLGLPESGSFIDIFHDESTPSANIYKDKNGTWFYKCFSSSHGFSGDLLRTVGELSGGSYASDLLIELIGIEIKPSVKIIQLREQWESILQVFFSNDFKENYPEVHSVFWRYKRDTYIIIDLMMKNMYEDIDTGEIRSLTYMSERRIAENLYGDRTKRKKVNRILNLLNYTEWVNKLDSEQIPSNLLEQLEDVRKANVKKFGGSKRQNVYEIMEYKSDDDFFTKLNSQCGGMKEAGFSMRSLNVEGIIAAEGKKRADKLYVQDKHKAVSSNTKDFYKSLYQVVTTLLRNNSFVYQNDVFDNLEGMYPSLSRTIIENNYRKLLPKLIKDENLTKSRLTNKLKEQFEVPKSKSYPTILYKTI